MENDLNEQDQGLLKKLNEALALSAVIKQKPKSKGAFPTQGSALKMGYLAIQQIQEKWQRTRVRNWHEIYPQLCLFFDEIMEKYEK
jgi:transposase-like protein